MADASILTPAERAAMITRTEDQLLDELTRILADAVNDHFSSPPVALLIPAHELTMVMGSKYAYLSATRCKFTLSDDGAFWVRSVGPVEGEAEIHPVGFWDRVTDARGAIDPLGLLEPLCAGAMIEDA